MIHQQLYYNKLLPFVLPEFELCGIREDLIQERLYHFVYTHRLSLHMITFMMMMTVKVCKRFSILNSLIWLLFYDDEDLGNLKRLYHIKCVYTISLHDDETIEMWETFTILNTSTGFLYIMVYFLPLNMTDMRMLYHTAYSLRVSHLYGFLYVFEDDCNIQSLYPLMTLIVFLWNMFSFISLESTATCKKFTIFLIFIGFYQSV